MKYIQIGDPNPLWILAAGVVFIAGIIGLILSARIVAKASNSEKGVGLTIASVLSLVLIAPMLAVNAFVAAGMEQRGKAAEVANDTYGTSFTGADMSYFRYPGEKPREAFEVFGSITMDTPLKGGFTRTEIFLIWQDGAMLLAQSTDGETFTEVEASTLPQKTE